MSEERIIYRIQHLRGTKEQWAEIVPDGSGETYGQTIKPLEGEFAIEMDKSDLKLHRLKIGDGEHTYDELPYMSTDNFVLPARIALTLYNDKWDKVYGTDKDGNQVVLYYFQNITSEQYGQLADVRIDDKSRQLLTDKSRIDLYNTSIAQLIDFKNNNFVFQAENDPINKVIRVVCLENKPENKPDDEENTKIELWCTITEEIDINTEEIDTNTKSTNTNSDKIIYGNIVGIPASGGSSSEGGVTSYDKLSGRPILVGRKYDENKGEVFNAYINDFGDPLIDDNGKEVVNNTAMGEYTASFGHGSRSGIKGYKILDITIEDSFADIKIDGILSEKWQSGDLVYVDCDIHSMGVYKIDSITTDRSDNNSIITILHPENKAIDSRLVMSASDENGMENWIWNPNYPDDGEVVIRSNTAFSSGDKTHVIGYGAAGFGRDNKVYGDYGFAGGRQNTVNYAGTAFGRGNLATGECATALNNKTKALGTASFASGYNTEAKATYSSAHNWNTKANQQASAAFGKYTTADRESQMAIGVYNEPDSTALFVVGNGGYIKTVDKDPVDGVTYYTKQGNEYIKFTGTKFTDGVDYYILKKQNAFVVKDTGVVELQTQGKTGNSVVIKDTLDVVENNLSQSIESKATQITNEINNNINPQIEEINSDIEEINSDIEEINSDIEEINDTMPIVSLTQPTSLNDGQVWLQPAAMVDYPVYVGTMETTYNSYTWVWYIEVKNSGRVDLKGTLKSIITLGDNVWVPSGGGYYAEIPGCIFPMVNTVQLPGKIITVNPGFIATVGTGNCWYWTEKVESNLISRGYTGRFTKTSVTGRPTLDIAGQLEDVDQFIAKL